MGLDVAAVMDGTRARAMTGLPVAVLVFAAVASACGFAQPIPPPDLPTAAPAPTGEPDYVGSATMPPATEAPPALRTPERVTVPGQGGEESGDEGGAAAFFLAQLLGDPYPEQFARLFAPARIAVPDRGPTPHSSTSVPPRAPDGDTRITQVGAVRLTLANGLPTAAGTCGQGQGYLVVCPADPDPKPASDYLLFYQLTAAPIGVTVASGLATYAFVLDKDGKKENNFKPDPQFPNDFYTGTDRWLEVSKTPNGKWQLDITIDPLIGGTQATVRSGARAIVRNNALWVLVPTYGPVSPFFDPARPNDTSGPGVVSRVEFRATAFRHNGDLGMAPPHAWSGDLYPRVGEPLARSSDRTLTIPSR